MIIQVPIVQLNTAYPSGAYLKSFFKMEGHNAFWYELNICLFYKIFSKKGLSYIFDKSYKTALEKIKEAAVSGDDFTAKQLERYLSQRDEWCDWIETITGILCERRDFSGRELCHEFVFSPYVPRGMRMENYLENLDHALSIDDSVFLASLALADIADYIQFVFDKDFALVRYAESLTVSEKKFCDIEKSLTSPILSHFYQEVLEEKFGKGSDFSKMVEGGNFTNGGFVARKEPLGRGDAFVKGSGSVVGDLSQKEASRILKEDTSFVKACGSVSGDLLQKEAACFVEDGAALGKEPFGRGDTFVKESGSVVGDLLQKEAGGFVEENGSVAGDLPQKKASRILKEEPSFVKACGTVSGDLPQKEAAPEKVLVCISIPFAGTFTPALYTAAFLKKCYGEKIFIAAGGGFVNTELREIQDAAFGKYFDSISYDRGYGSYKKLFENHLSKKNQIYKMRFFDDGKILEPLWQDKETEFYENEITGQVAPDYSEIDFSVYPRMADDVNPMQRMWSDGSWMKAYLAHGCYWHKCDFCDVNLDYVCAYHLVDVEKIFNSLQKQCRQKGVYGIHFVDEALPLVALKKFAFLNCKSKNQSVAPLTYWGNIRFEKFFNHDTAAFLSYAGLAGVSGGIEIARADGLDNIHKGVSLDSIVASCCAFKEAGILVHAYMIYGYWNESDLDTINSMETLRQFYKAGLLDSSFWHKFVLTRNSRIYGEYKNGMHKNLKPVEDEDGGIFAKNTMHFKGEEKSEKFHDGLNAALENWMHGRALDKRVNKWFDFPTPEPTVSKTLVEDAILRYEKKKEEEAKAALVTEKLFYLGGRPLTFSMAPLKTKIVWYYMHEEFSMEVKLDLKEAEEFAAAIYSLRPEIHDEAKIKNLLEKSDKAPLLEKYIFAFRKNCLVQL